MALWFAARAFRSGERRDYALLGLALGGVLLSRMFGFALVAGIAGYALLPAHRRYWREGLALSFGICALVYSPFVIWNAAHEWVTFAFALVHRHEGERLMQSSLRHVLSLYAAQAAAYSPGIWLGVLILALRPRNAFLAWTALPLLGTLTLLALFRDVEIHWAFGAFASLCAMMGIAYVQLAARRRIVWTTIALVPAAVLLPAIFAMAFAPVASYRIIQRETGVQLRNAGPFEMFAYRPLARDLARIAREAARDRDDGRIRALIRDRFQRERSGRRHRLRLAGARIAQLVSVDQARAPRALRRQSTARGSSRVCLAF